MFRAINKAGLVWGHGMSPKVIWDVVRNAAYRADIAKLATERYLGCKQKLRYAVNDTLGIEPECGT